MAKVVRIMLDDDTGLFFGVTYEEQKLLQEHHTLAECRGWCPWGDFYVLPGMQDVVEHLLQRDLEIRHGHAAEGIEEV